MTQPTFAERYILLALLGQGASGQVWRAQDSMLGRLVAIKLVDLAVVRNAPQIQDVVARFRREALAVGGLHHPNIVSAFDAGRAGDTLYLVMELVAGSSLARLIAQRTAAHDGLMPLAQVVDIAMQVSAGLASAHAAGVVHRDLKPGNLVVDEAGHVKIIDFGIARFVHDDMPRLTLPGSAVGTPSYVAPEQAEGRPVDGRADLYSLGCVLYELIAGQRPFDGEIPAALLYQQLYQQPVPLRTRRPDVPGGLAVLVGQLMEKSADSRPASAADVLASLTAIRRGLGVPEAPSALPQAAERPGGGAVAPGAAAGEAARVTVRAADVTGEVTVGPEPGLAGGPGPGQAGSSELRPVGRPGPGLAGGPGPGQAGSSELSPAGRPRPGQAGIGPEPGQAAAGWPAGPAGTRLGPGQPGGGPGSAEPGEAPAAWWRADQHPRRRGRHRGWLAFAGAFVLAALAAAVVALAWPGGGGALAVTAVAVAPASPPPAHRCHITVVIVGTIITNGRGGNVTYQWTRSDGTTSRVDSVTLPSGRSTEQVRLRWLVRGTGTARETATLRVLSPSVLHARTSFTYSCR